METFDREKFNIYDLMLIFRASWGALDKVSKMANNTGVDWINKNFRFAWDVISKFHIIQAVLQVWIENSLWREGIERLPNGDLDRFGHDGREIYG